MSRSEFLLTLYAGESTKEISFGRSPRGEVVAMDESEWDGPMSRIERATLEVLRGPGIGKRMTMPGDHYLQLDEAEAIEGLFEAMAKGRRPSDALSQALVLIGVAA